MRWAGLLLLLLAFAQCRPPRGSGQDAVVIVAGRLIDPATGRVASNREILVEGRRITAVGSRVRRPPSAPIVDLSRYTVLPGLIDGHVHLAIGGTVAENALADLRAGFTTVVDLGARTERLLRLRDSINAGLLPGPRVLAAGIWIGSRNGVCEFGGIGIAGGPEAFARRARENILAGADVIKVCVSGWPAVAHAHSDSVEMTDAAIAAVVREAHAARRMVIAHDISSGGVRAALRTGVDGLAHAAYLDSWTAASLRARDMFMIPTLASLTGNDTGVAARDLIASTRLAYDAGVSLVFGTDGGVLPHGQNAAELVALQSAGVSALDAIRAATTNAAAAFRIADSVGAIRPGMSADIIAVEGDPLTDIRAISRVRYVMSRGREIDLPRPP